MTITYADQFTFENPTVALVIQRVTGINRKVTPQDCEQSKTLRTVAEWYATWYNGTFEYMVSMHSAMTRWGKLSPAQCSGTINCMLNDWRYQQRKAAEMIERATTSFKMPEATLPDPPQSTSIAAPEASQVMISAPIEQACLNGTYTIVLNEKGDYRTIELVDCPDSFSKPEGTQIARYLSGPDNDSDYTGFAFVFGKQIAVWSRFKADSQLARALQVLLSTDRDGQIDLGEAYALASGKCFRCGRTLTVEASIKRGLGPICAGYFGL